MTNSARLTFLTRLGFAARGLLYIVIAMLVIRSGRTEDPSGAMAELGQDGGDPLLLAMAVGFIAYGIWRLVDAAFNIEGHEQGAKGTRERLAAAGSGSVYSLLAWQAFKLMDGGAAADAGSDPSQSASTALQLPGGPLLVSLAGAVLVGVGAYQLVKAYNCSFCDRLEPRVANQAPVRWIGRAGYSARGLIFMVSGYFIAKAGLTSRASEAGGMEEALRWLDSPVDLTVAAGLLLFGVFSIVEARFRIIRPVPIERAARAVSFDPRQG
jgi:hypothetical protein